MSTGRRYSNEFKEAAVVMVMEGRNPSAVAKDLGVSPQTLAMWIRKHTEKKNPENAKIAELEAELKARNKRIAELEMSNDILKKATAIFARDNQK